MVSLTVNSALHRLAVLDPEIVVELLTEVRLNDGGSFRIPSSVPSAILLPKSITTTLSHTP